MNKSDKINLEEAYLKIYLKEEDMGDFENESEEDLVSSSEPEATTESESSPESSAETEEEPSSEVTESKKHDEDSEDEEGEECDCGEEKESECTCEESNDLNSLQKAYEVVQENWLKKMGAAAAMGAAAMSPIHAKQGMTADDYADKAAIEYAQSKSEATPEEALKAAIENIHANQPVSKPMLHIIARDPEIAKRCAYLYFMKGMEIPQILRNVIGGYEKELKSHLENPMN